MAFLASAGARLQDFCLRGVRLQGFRRKVITGIPAPILSRTQTSGGMKIAFETWDDYRKKITWSSNVQNEQLFRNP